MFLPTIRLPSSIPKPVQKEPVAIRINVRAIINDLEEPMANLCECEISPVEFIEIALHYITEKRLIECGLDTLGDEVYHAYVREFGEVEATAAQEAALTVANGLYSKFIELGAYREGGEFIYTKVGNVTADEIILVPEDEDSY